MVGRCRLTAIRDAAGGQRFTSTTTTGRTRSSGSDSTRSSSFELPVETGDGTKRLADATLDLLRETLGAAACVVFSNTPNEALWRRAARASCRQVNAASVWALRRSSEGGFIDEHGGDGRWRQVGLSARRAC